MHCYQSSIFFNNKIYSPPNITFQNQPVNSKELVFSDHNLHSVKFIYHLDSLTNKLCSITKSATYTFRIPRLDKKIVTDRSDSNTPQVFQEDGEILPTIQPDFIPRTLFVLSPITTLIWTSLMNNEFDKYDFQFLQHNATAPSVVDRFNETNYVQNHLIYRDHPFMIMNGKLVVIGDVYFDEPTNQLRLIHNIVQTKSSLVDKCANKADLNRLSDNFGVFPSLLLDTTLLALSQSW